VEHSSRLLQLKNNDDGQKKVYSAINWPVIPNFFIAHSSILVGLQWELGAPYPVHLAIKCLMANYCMRWRGIFKGHSREGALPDFSKKPPRIPL
jgi:hypothetical protein